MRAIVCVKQVPDPASAATPSLNTSWLVPEAAAILDDGDRYGVELGLQLTEAAAEDGSVTLVSLGSGASDEGLRQALAMGRVDKAIVIRPDAEHGADALTTARALAAVIADEGFDLVITGTASTDGSAGVMCQMLGELLGAPSITEVTNAVVADGTLTVHRQTTGGYDLMTCALPAVISVTAGSVEPRYPTVKGVMSSKRKPIERKDLAEVLEDWSPADLPRVSSVQTAAIREAGRKVEDDGSAHLAVISILEEQGII